MDDIVIPRSTKAISEELIVQNIHSYMGVIATTQRWTMYRPNKNKEEKVVTYYAVTFAPSASGKSHTYNLMSKHIFAWYERVIKTKYREEAERINNDLKKSIALKMEQGVDEFGLEYKSKDAKQDMKNLLIPTDYEMAGLKVASATAPSVAQKRASLSKFDRFGIRILQDELSTLFKSPKREDTYKAILETWEEGNMEVDGTKYDQISSSGMIPTSFIGYTAEGSIFKDPKMFAGFNEFLELGLARRANIVYLTWEDFSDKKIPKVESNSEEAIKRIEKKIMNNLLDVSTILQRTGSELRDERDRLGITHGCRYKPISFNEEAIMFMRKYSTRILDESKSMYDKTEAYIASYAGLDVKSEKLAAIYAAMDGRAIIGKQDCEEATYWCEYIQQYIDIVSKKRTPPERIALDLIKANKPISLYKIEQNGYFDRVFNLTRQMEESIPQISQILAANKHDLVLSDSNGGTNYEARPAKYVDKHKISFSWKYGNWSTSDTRARELIDGYEKVTIDFDEIDTLLCGKRRGSLIASQLKGGKASNDNAIGEVHLICLDFDDTIPVEAALSVYSDYEFFLYTTKSHGIKGERFRMLFPVEKPITLDKNRYKDMMQNIRKNFALMSDEQCVNIGRMFDNNPDADFDYNNGIMFPAHQYIVDEVTYKNGKREVFIKQDSNDKLKTWFEHEALKIASTLTGGYSLMTRAVYSSRDVLNFSTENELLTWLLQLKDYMGGYWEQEGKNYDLEILSAVKKVFDIKQ